MIEASSTYQTILADGKAKGLVAGRLEGRLQEAQETLIRIGSRRFGTPDTSIQSILECAALPRLHEWIDRVAEVESWQELLAA